MYLIYSWGIVFTLIFISSEYWSLKKLLQTVYGSIPFVVTIEVWKWTVLCLGLPELPPIFTCSIKKQSRTMSIICSKKKFKL